LIALVGVGLAILGVFTMGRIIRQSLAPLPAPTPKPAITVQAVVTTHDVALGGVLRSDDIKLVDVPVELAPPGVISDPEQVIGRITKVQLVAGEMVMDHNLADPSNVNGDLGFVIGDNQVLMAFPATDLISTLDVLQRGDLVDILASIEAPRPQGLDRPGAEAEAVEEVEVLTGMITFDALQRLEITAMVVEIQQEEQRSAVPEVPTGGTPQPQPTPQPREVKVLAYLLALTPQDALALKNLKDNGATFDFVLRAPTSTQLFELQTITTDYLIDRYEFAVPK
jgi:Flp pilus assembly protein CpaB